jgi:hypothetical protein
VDIGAKEHKLLCSPVKVPEEHKPLIFFGEPRGT